MVTRSEQIAKARQRRLHPTAAQARLRQLIRDHGDRLRRQMLFGTSVVHFVLPYRNLLINVFGERCPRDKSQAERLDGWLKSLGFNYLELTAAEVFDLPQLLSKLSRRFPSAGQRAESGLRAGESLANTRYVRLEHCKQMISPLRSSQSHPA